MKSQDQKFLRRCIQLSAEALASGNNPFGCVIVKNNEIIVASQNDNETDVTGHAEILAMRKAQEILKTKDLSDCTIYSNCEPCPMCSFMMRELRFARVVFALPSPAMGGSSRWDILGDEGIAQFSPPFSAPPELVSGLLREEAAKVFDDAGWTFHRE